MQFCQLTILKALLLVLLKDQQLLCLLLYKLNSQWLISIRLFNNFLKNICWFFSEIWWILMCVFHWCNKSHPHKFIAMLFTYGLNFPICSSDSIHSTHLTLYFTWNKVAITRCSIFTSWRCQTGCQDLGKIIATYTYTCVYQTLIVNVILALVFYQL